MPDAEMSPENAAESLGLTSFQDPPDEDGLSLEQLSSAYAELLTRGANPYDEPVQAAEASEGSVASGAEVDSETHPADLTCDLTPKSILEAILFVGSADNRPITSRQVAALMRGVRPQEIDDWVQELNTEYARDGAPYSIESVEAGYRLSLREELRGLRDAFYGRVKESRLTQPAIDVLAIVAYRQPIAREEVDTIRGKPSGGMLAQLLRRGLLRLDREEKRSLYRTTDRFLKLFGLEALEELPQSQDVLPEG